MAGGMSLAFIQEDFLVLLVFLPPTSEGWGKVSHIPVYIPMGGTAISGQDRTGGYPSPGLDGGYPHPMSGTPCPDLGWGTAPPPNAGQVPGQGRLPPTVTA